MDRRIKRALPPAMKRKETLSQATKYGDPEDVTPRELSQPVGLRSGDVLEQPDLGTDEEAGPGEEQVGAGVSRGQSLRSQDAGVELSYPQCECGSSPELCTYTWLGGRLYVRFTTVLKIGRAGALE